MERLLSPTLLGSTARGKCLGVSLVSLFRTLFFAQSMVLVTSEIIKLDMILDASSDEVHFIRGYLQAPALINLANISLFTDEEMVFDLGDDGYKYEYGDDATYGGDDEYETHPPSLETESPVIVEPPGSSASNITGTNDENTYDEEKSGNLNTTAEENTIGKESSDLEAAAEQNHGNQTSDELVREKEDFQDDTVNEPATDNDTDEVGTQSPIKSENTNEGDVVEHGGDITYENKTGAENEEEETTESLDREGDKANNQEEGKSVPVTTSKEDDDVEDNVEDMTNEEGNISNNEDKDEIRPTPATPTEEEKVDVENGGESTTEGDNVEEEEPTPGAPSGDGIKVGSGEDDEEEQNNGVKSLVDDQNSNTSRSNSTATERTEEPASAPTAENNRPTGDRSLQDTNREDPTTTNQIMDVVLFLIPGDCKSDMWGNCDWVSLGVGSYDDEMEGGMSYCCSKDTSERGICNSDDIGKMMIDHKIFEGDHREIPVPSQPFEQFVMDNPSFEVKKSGDYIIVIANCNDDGLGVITLGNMEWKSVGGYLPGDIFGLMFYFGGITAVYLVLGLWYFCGMRMFQDAAIPIQKYILGTIILGFLESLFQGMNLFFWNVTGIRSPYVMYTALGLGILFQGSLRCLGVMVAMGWGVVRDTLGMALCKIIMLGLLYSGLTLVRDFIQVAASSVQSVKLTEEEELVDLALVLSPIIFCINIVFYFWIISSVMSTTDYLRNMNQTSKLRRHLRLRCLIITSLVIISILMVVNAVQVFYPFLNQDQMWIIKAVGHGNYLFILFGVTILWRPNADAKDYAMQMQVPSHADDENELELSCVVPSADDVGMSSGYKVDGAVVT